MPSIPGWHVKGERLDREQGVDHDVMAGRTQARSRARGVGLGTGNENAHGQASSTPAGARARNSSPASRPRATASATGPSRRVSTAPVPSGAITSP